MKSYDQCATWTHAHTADPTIFIQVLYSLYCYICLLLYIFVLYGKLTTGTCEAISVWLKGDFTAFEVACDHMLLQAPTMVYTVL